MSKKIIKSFILIAVMAVLCVAMVVTAGAECEHSWYWYDDDVYNCELGGSVRYRCEYCDYIKTENIEPKEHDIYIYDHYIDGCGDHTTYRCRNCSAINEKVTVSEKHDWHWYDGDVYNCEEGGTIWYICSRCENEFKTEIVEPKEHDWYEGYTYTDECWEVVLYRCRDCRQEKEEVVSENHNWIKGTSSDDRLYDCKNGGYEWYNCDRCYDSKSVYVEPKEHDWYEDYTYTYDCEELAVYRCHDCKQEKEEVVSSWHDWYEHEFYGNCEEGGKMEYFCHNCSYEKYEPVDPRPHTIEWHYYNDATCTKDGTKYSYCTVCDYDNGDEPVIDEGSALGHDFSGEWMILLSPTCYDRGVQIKHCLRCTEITAEELARTAHTDNDGDSKCDECLDSLSGATIPDTPDEPDTPDTPDTPEVSKAEANIFSFLTEFLNNLLDFFRKLFGIA